jgi:hypothetical protein
MQTILAILKLAGGWHPGLHLHIDNPPYMALVIEALDESGPMGLPALSVTHYGEQNGDAMRDPEMCFELGLAGGAHLSAFYFRNDYLGVEQWRGERAYRKRGCVNERETFGNPGKNSVIHRHTFSPGTISRHISCTENSIASFEPANTGAGLDNHTGKFPTKQDTTARFCAACPADESFAWVDPDCMNGNKHIELSKGGFRDFCQFDSEVFEAVRFVVDEGLHRENLSRNVSRIPASGPPSC